MSINASVQDALDAIRALADDSSMTIEDRASHLKYLRKEISQQLEYLGCYDEDE